MSTAKSRGKTHRNGKWYYGSLVYSNEINAAIYFQIGSGLVKTMDWVYVIPETVGQFTGLMDKKGKEIYEGDIVKWSNGMLYTVKFWDGMFYASIEECNDGFLGGFPLHALTDYEDRVCEIVGNIHDNTELLKGGKK